MLKLTSAMFLLGPLRLSLFANVNLNLWGSFVWLFSVFIKIVSIFK